MLLPVVVVRISTKCYTLLGFQLNPLTAMLPALMAVGLADGLHILSQCQCSGLEPKDAIIFSINETIGACAQRRSLQSSDRSYSQACPYYATSVF